MKTLICLLALSLTACSLTPRQKAIGTAILVTSVALSLRHSDNGNDPLKTTQPVSCINMSCQ